MKNKQPRLALLAAVCAVALCACGTTARQTAEPVFDLTPGAAVSDSAPLQRSPEEIISDLNRQVENGMITMSMNPEPVFETGTAAGNLLIENDPANKSPIVVQIFRNDTGDLIYTSGAIPVGKFINEDTLDAALDAGDYPCTAYFNTVDDGTGAVLGTGAVHITLHISH